VATLTFDRQLGLDSRCTFIGRDARGSDRRHTPPPYVREPISTAAASTFTVSIAMGFLLFRFAIVFLPDGKRRA